MKNNNNQIVIDHAYSDYDFYNCVFVPSRVPKLLEAEGACFVIENLLTKNPELKNKDLNIVEFMSGRGEFEDFIRAEAKFNIGKYVGIDAVPQNNLRTELVIGDVTKTFPNFEADIIMALYYSASSVHGKEGFPTASAMRDMCKNAHNNLKSGGGFLLGFAAQGEALSFDLSEGEDEEDKEVTIPIYNGLRKRFNLSETEAANLSFEQDNIYDRFNGTVVETMKNIRVLNSRKKIVGRIKIKNPLYQLYMSESHIVDNLKQAGFNNLMFFDISFDEGHVSMEVLDNIMKDSESFSTHILAIKN
ncbi:hypothetical protein OAK17_07975 [Alphaproteobacteria bacterium]|nr:hypothetical protein [Alphaproteobacteria bacterium]